MSPAERLVLLERVRVAVHELVADLAGDPGHRATCARAQLELVEDAADKARGFLSMAQSSAAIRAVDEPPPTLRRSEPPRRRSR